MKVNREVAFITLVFCKEGRILIILLRLMQGSATGFPKHYTVAAAIGLHKVYVIERVLLNYPILLDCTVQ